MNEKSKFITRGFHASIYVRYGDAGVPREYWQSENEMS